MLEMNEEKKTEKKFFNGKAVYEKPVIQVYEMEIEGAILEGSNTQMFVNSFDSVWDNESE